MSASPWQPLKIVAAWTNQPIDRVRWWARSQQISSACRVADRVIVVNMLDVTSDMHRPT